MIIVMKPHSSTEMIDRMARKIEGMGFKTAMKVLDKARIHIGAVCVGAATRILPLLAATGAIVRDRPRGGWTGSQYRWVPIERLGPRREIDPEAARAELLHAWLAAFGPATETDLR